MGFLDAYKDKNAKRSDKGKPANFANLPDSANKESSKGQNTCRPANFANYRPSPEQISNISNSTQNTTKLKQPQISKISNYSEETTSQTSTRKRTAADCGMVDCRDCRFFLGSTSPCAKRRCPTPKHLWRRCPDFQ